MNVQVNSFRRLGQEIWILSVNGYIVAQGDREAIEAQAEAYGVRRQEPERESA